MAAEQLQLIPRDSKDGQYVPYTIDFAHDQWTDEHFRFRLGRNAVNEPVMQKMAHAGTRARELLDHEWRIGKWLGDQGRDYVSTMLGHNPDAVPPFTVMTLRGEPLSRLSVPVDRETLRMLVAGLLHGLEVLRSCGVVHRRLNLDTLRWDGGSLQITDFTHAQYDGAGDTVSHGEDVYAAGLVIFHLYTGELPEDDPARMEQRLRGQDVLLRRLLAGESTGAERAVFGERTVFADRAEDRPDARELLERWTPGGRATTGLARAYRDREREGRRNFHELRARQHAYGQRHRGWTPPPRRRPWIVPKPQAARAGRARPRRLSDWTLVAPLRRPPLVRAAAAVTVVGVLVVGVLVVVAALRSLL